MHRPGTASPQSGSARSIAFHDRLADGWDRRYAGGGFKRRADLFTHAVLPNIACRGAWIDVGCGGGYFSRRLAERGAGVLGVDGSAAMIAAARAAIPPGLSHALRFEVAAIETLEALQAIEPQGARFDGAICLSVLEYLDEPAAALACIAALLKPGGTLVVSAPNRHSALRGLQTTLRRALRLQAFAYLNNSKWSWSRNAFMRLAGQQGLVVEAVVGFDPRVPRPFWFVLPPSLFFLICRKADVAR